MIPPSRGLKNIVGARSAASLDGGGEYTITGSGQSAPRQLFRLFQTVYSISFSTSIASCSLYEYSCRNSSSMAASRRA